MIHDEDSSGHKTWRLIYAAIFIANLLFISELGSPIITAAIGVISAFLFWGQQKSIDDIKARENDNS
jgi:hypothetical protein